MRKITALYTLLVGAIFLTSLVAVPVASAVDAPDYSKDDGWAVGQTISMNWEWDDMPAEVKTEVAAALDASGLDVDKLDLSFDAAFYAYLTIEEVKDDDYVVSAKMAIKVAASGEVAVSGEMPKAGSYNITIADSLDNIELDDIDDIDDIDFQAIGIDVEDKTISLDLAVDFAFILSGTMVMEKEDLAIKSLDLNLKTAAVIGFDAKNIPDIEDPKLIFNSSSQFIPTNVLVNVSYDNYDVDLKASFDANLNIVFEPALNIYDFPMVVGNEWTIDSEATISGGLKGFIDVTGLPEELEDDLFDEEGELFGAGFTKFPLVFDEFESDDLVIKDGKLEEFVTDIVADVRVASTTNVDGEVVFNLEASTDDGDFEYMYSPVLLDIFSLDSMPDLGGDDLPIDLDMLEELGMTFTDEEPTVDEAKAEIKSIENYYNTVDKKANGSSGLDFDIMTLVIILAAVVIIAGVAVVLLKRKK